MKLWQFPLSKTFIDLETIQLVMQPRMYDDNIYGFSIVVALQTNPIIVGHALSSEAAAAEERKLIDDEMVKLVAAWQGIVEPEVVVPLTSLSTCHRFGDKLHLVLKPDSSAELEAMLNSMSFEVQASGSQLLLDRTFIEKLYKKASQLKLASTAPFNQLKKALQ